ncbi:MAG: LPS export ABC transporter permease LptF [Deltaproteobacteria bacterium CG_4_9_14_3_um_filter_44_9]|nr:MAG: LPS export ABC transporter permease LptF [Deltaproteobacteria bacterium CG2_30_43_15]PIU85893.1 MAG: LPS export ABC transporter permease LptF [Deltaproteobacteria bacterium CG06_land_8_20_14_3_00_44_19]PIX23353.1 MAG: LPS export ABC transporter permease LptF [Deltaproteobacteria bacterium CG_4_8_14_3_um_filter_43_13]PIZ19022.1 MAG: LPS export ABC transporter permease LptF [Deltaproteobacteria bacterium CG_4_10_14_0_8_um_filter_43_12]PJB40406.1 MAG: LPS export ABC transporter permease Lp
MKRTISFYLTKEIMGPFFVGLLIFTFIFLMNSILRLTELVVNKGVKLIDILKLILYAMPSFLVFTVPMALLMAVLAALGRLSGDNEITAMKVSGIGIYQLVAPIMIFSLVCSLLTSFVAVYALPWGNSSTRELIFNIARNKVNIGIKERTFNSDFKGLVLYVNEIAVRGEKLKGILVSEKGETGEPNTIVAREGYLISDPKSLIITLRLIDGKIHRASKDLNTYQEIGFSTYDINLDLGTIIKEQGSFTKEYSEMSIGELQRKIEELRKGKKSLYHPLQVLYEKFSVPFACLVFGLIAIPLGIQSRPSSKFWGFILSLVVILIYYVFLTFGQILAKNGEIPLPIALWAPNFFIGILGVYMLYKTANDLPINFIVWIERIFRKIGLKT